MTSSPFTNDLLTQENASLVVPWIIGFLTFMSLETVAMVSSVINELTSYLMTVILIPLDQVYSNVLRDHIFKVHFLPFLITEWHLPNC